VAPAGVELTEIFRGALPFLSMVLIAMALVYTVPAATTWLPNLVYGTFR
jgi:TRAP-type mannitol/chloroaromatic compound transport system permease large subunit